jgi:hypothetical protein
MDGIIILNWLLFSTRSPKKLPPLHLAGGTNPKEIEAVI